MDRPSNPDEPRYESSEKLVDDLFQNDYEELRQSAILAYDRYGEELSGHVTAALIAGIDYDALYDVLEDLHEYDRIVLAHLEGERRMQSAESFFKHLRKFVQDDPNVIQRATSRDH